MSNLDQLIKQAEQFYLLSTAKEKKVYGPFYRKDKRAIVIIVNEDGSRRTVSFPKYIMEQHLGRPLDPNIETVDHINRDHSDNSIDNLRVIDRKQHSADDTRRVKLIDLECDQCHKKFQRSPRLMRDKNKKGSQGKFCSKSCSARYSREVQLGRAKPLPIQPFTQSEYYRNIKKLESLAEQMLVKYAGQLLLD